MQPDAGQFNALIATLHEEGARKKDEILRHAREEAARIVEEARLRAGEADRRSMDAFRQKTNDRVARKVNNAKREARRVVEEAGAEVIRRTVGAVLVQLEHVRSTPEYPEILEALLAEVLQEFDGEAVIMADGREIGLIRAMAASSRYDGVRLEEAPGLGGGLEARSIDGRIIIRNTFASRVAKAQDLLVEETGKRMESDNV